ncbi:phosphotransferase [bacterium]|nr:phosphotransferase [bacterium]
MEEIITELLENLGYESGTEIKIIKQNTHKHSVSMILQVKESKVFVKFGTHFSGKGSWDVESEFLGYKIASEMKLDENIFFSVKPILFRTEPEKIIATVFVSGTTLETLYKQSLKKELRSVGTSFLGTSFLGTLSFLEVKTKETQCERLTKNLALWLLAFTEETKNSGEKINSQEVFDFCKERFNEIVCGAKETQFRRTQFRRNAVSNFEFYLKSLFDGKETINTVRIHNDFGPHNVFINSEGKLGVIDFGFSKDKNYPLPFEDAAFFMIYLEQMENNPIYIKKKVQALTKIFAETILEKTKHNDFYLAYWKKTLAHVAWFYNPERKKGRFWQEFSYGKWAKEKMKKLSENCLNHGLN